jgi:hypothetical protein
VTASSAGAGAPRARAAATTSRLAAAVAAEDPAAPAPPRGKGLLLGVAGLAVALAAAIGWVMLSHREAAMPAPPAAGPDLPTTTLAAADAATAGGDASAGAADSGAPAAALPEAPERGPAPSPPPLPVARWSIASQPAGATILLDGLELLQKTPATLEVKPGVHHAVKLRLDGHAETGDEWTPASGGEKTSLLSLRRLASPEEDAGTAAAAPAPASPEPARPGRGSRSRAKRGRAGRAAATKTPAARASRTPGKGGAAEATPAPAPAPAPAVPAGTLSLVTAPWTDVYLGSRLLGRTPLARLKLPAGKHTLTLVNELAGIRQSYPVTIKPDEHIVRRKDLR